VNIPQIRKKFVAKVNFPKFIPEIDVLDERPWFWKYGVEFPMIFVLLWQLLVNKDALSRASSKGLHDYLGFDGKILLSTVMQDELIDKLKREDYFKLIADLRPDVTMIPDNYTYTDVPLHQSWSQTIRLVTFANDFLELDIPVIGLVKGADAHQIAWSLQKQIEMGYNSFVMPSRELFEEGLLNDFLQSALLILDANRDINGLDSELLLYGISQKLRYEEVSYSNLSWFIEAKRGNYLKGGMFYELEDPEIRFEECRCEACKGMMPQELIDLSFEDRRSYMKALVAHNLLELKRTLGGN